MRRKVTGIKYQSKNVIKLQEFLVNSTDYFFSAILCSFLVLISPSHFLLCLYFIENNRISGVS